MSSMPASHMDTVRTAWLLASYAANVPHAGHGMQDPGALRDVAAALERHWPEVEAVLQRAYAHADAAAKLRVQGAKASGDDPLTRALHRSATSVAAGHDKGPCGPLVAALVRTWDDRAAALVRGKAGMLALGVLAHVLTRLAQSVALVAKHGRGWWERDNTALGGKDPEATIRKEGKALMALLTRVPHSEPHAGGAGQQEPPDGADADEPHPGGGGRYTPGVVDAIKLYGIPDMPEHKNKGTKKDDLIMWLIEAGEGTFLNLKHLNKLALRDKVREALAKRS